MGQDVSVRQTTVAVESTPSSSGESRMIVTTQNGISSNPVERATSLWAALGQSFLNSSPAPWQGFCPVGCALRIAFVCTRMAYLRFACGHEKVRRLMTRVQTTLRGSADDIGWLQKTPGFPPVEDGTQRFEEILGDISHGLHALPNDYVYLLVPGLFSNHGPLYFVDTKRYFSKLGLTCHIARIHSEAAVETNARELKDYIEELYWGTGKKIVLLGHSKGGVDAAAAASMFWPEIKDKVVGIVLVQSPYGGSPLASDILREGQIADVETRRIMELLICKIIKGDMTALEDLTHDKRRKFLAKYPLPPDLPVVSFHTEAGKSPGVLSTLSHIAHAELPWLPLAGAASEAPATTAKLPVVLPLAAAMAACALHLELRYSEKSDGLVSRKDAEVPGSVVVRPNRKLDHAWMVYSTDPEAFRMCEALMSLLLEVSHKKNRASDSGSCSNTTNRECSTSDGKE
ncbi:uncharacterized protein LOC9644802 [Selaginella moellendorffii]|nr:uncharacterized protein LOC9644802 [Selaginella moellendorffii]|eukprot:XP_002984672.2 uncharacterized protein LOC9644802 [Selaginella moellendorffii]